MPENSRRPSRRRRARARMHTQKASAWCQAASQGCDETFMVESQCSLSLRFYCGELKVSCNEGTSAVCPPRPAALTGEVGHTAKG